MPARILMFIALFVSLFAVAGTAQAAPAAGRTALVLSVQESEVEGGAFKVTVLTCERGDAHPRRAQACRTLAANQANLDAMEADDRPCPYIYAPVEVSMFGFWRGEPVTQVRTFPNSCVMRAHTGAVFDF
jgi:hypothetical protein